MVDTLERIVMITFSMLVIILSGMFTDKGKFNNENFMNSIITVKFTRLHIPHNYHI